ncbi:putative transposase [Shigella dysenteriae 155-74]|nr:putative transposase [Shigella dysenteriae 155-74]
MDSARALIARGWGVSLVSRCLRVSRAQLHVILRRTDDWMDGRRSRHTDDTDVLLRIHHVIGELPTYGYRRVWALLRRQAELDGMLRTMPNVFTGSCARMRCCLSENLLYRHRNGHIQAEWP